MLPLGSQETADLLAYTRLADEIGRVLLEQQAGEVRVPERIVLELAHEGKLLVMPAADRETAITKLVTVHPGNSQAGLPTIQGEVVVMRAGDGQRLAILDGAAVTARRTSALSLLAARQLAPSPAGPLLVYGAGAQAKAHIEAFQAGLGVKKVAIVSRTQAKAQELARHARVLGLDASVAASDEEPLVGAKLIVTATNSDSPILHGALAEDVMVCAVGAFRPHMAELSSATIGSANVVVDTLEGARAEAGDLIAAVREDAWSWDRAQELVDVVQGQGRQPRGPIIFKSVGHAMFDLAAARLVRASRSWP